MLIEGDFAGRSILRRTGHPPTDLPRTPVRVRNDGGPAKGRHEREDHNTVEISGSAAIITGAASGLGAATAKRFADLG
ncbi:hypothetical protein ACW9HQ_43840, partial [Nocardia gipuzkoensis]